MHNMNCRRGRPGVANEIEWASRLGHRFPNIVRAAVQAAQSHLKLMEVTALHGNIALPFDEPAERQMAPGYALRTT